MIDLKDLDARIKKLVCEQHFQYYDCKSGELTTIICSTTSDEDDIWAHPYVLGKCLKCMDVERVFKEAEDDGKGRANNQP